MKQRAEQEAGGAGPLQPRQPLASRVAGVGATGKAAAEFAITRPPHRAGFAHRATRSVRAKLPIMVVGNYEADRQHSMLQYNLMVARAAAAAGLGEVRLVRPKSIFGDLSPRLYWLLSSIDKYLLAPWAFPKAGLAIVADQGLGLYVPRLRADTKIIVCHDMIAHLTMAGKLDGSRPSRLGRFLQRANLAGIKRADHIVCISEATRRDVLELTGIPAERVSVIHNCLPPAIVEAAKAPSDAAVTRGADVLCFATSFYKNAELSLSAFARARSRLPAKARLVVIGRDTAHLKARAAEMGLADGVVWLGAVSDTALFDLYRTAGVLLFPSIYEGFGWPVLEAQAFDMPVVTSDAASLPEVAGQGAVICPLDEASIADALVLVLGDPAFAAALTMKGRENLRRFSQEAWLSAYVALFRSFGTTAPAPQSPEEFRS